VLVNLSVLVRLLDLLPAVLVNLLVPKQLTTKLYLKKDVCKIRGCNFFLSFSLVFKN
jgi:hypothetical protein